MAQMKKHNAFHEPLPENNMQVEDLDLETEDEYDDASSVTSGASTFKTFNTYASNVSKCSNISFGK